MNKIKLLVQVLGAMIGVSSALGQSIVSYDVTGALASGSGVWYHAYNGTITQAGSYSNSDVYYADHYYTYVGGSGTLNDGQHAVSTNDNMLFDSKINPSITLHLDGYYTISSIALCTGSELGNSIPGTIASVRFGIGGASVTETGSGFGTFDYERYSDLSFSFSGAFSQIATNVVTLSNFSPGWHGLFSIGEITVVGTSASDSPVSAVPESSTYGLMGVGALAGVAFLRRRRKA